MFTYVRVSAIFKQPQKVFFFEPFTQGALIFCNKSFYAIKNIQKIKLTIRSKIQDTLFNK